MTANYYEVLGCSPSASYGELKAAYRKKALESHPDKNTNSSKSNSSFNNINEAWKTLGNPERRKEYDSQLRELEIDEIRATIYANVTFSDLEETEDSDVLSYPCRCGNKYLIEKSDALEPNCILHIPCEDCTFVIKLET